MRKSSIIILVLNLISIAIGLYILRETDILMTNYAIDNTNHIPLTKGNLFLIGIVPFIVVFTMDIVATLEASEVKPFIRYYDRLKYVICFAFQLLFSLIVLSQVYIMNEKYIIGTMLSIVIMYVGYTLPKISRNQVFGFKNKWTLNSDYVWAKVHSRARVLAYLISVVVLFLTFSKHYTIATFVIILVILSVFYLIYYSYQLDKQKPTK